MKSAIEQSIKEKIKALAKERESTFAELWRNLIRLDVLDSSLAKKAVQIVFHHRKTPLKKLPISFGKVTFETLEKNWTSYWRKIKARKSALKLPESIEDVVSVLNKWLEENLL